MMYISTRNVHKMSQLVSQTNEEKFLKAVFLISRSIKTKKTYKTAINHLKKFIETEFERDESEVFAEIKNGKMDLYQFLQDFVIYLDSRVNAKGMRGYLSGAKGYIRHHGIRIDSDDFKQFVKVPKIVRTKEIPLTKDMLLRILHNSNAKLQTAILVALASGLRIGELTQLKLSDIDFESNPTRICVRAETSKTRRGRETFITTEATNALKDYLSRYFGWNEADYSHLKETYIFGPTTNKGRKSKVEGFNVESAKLSLQQSLRTHVRSIPELDIVNDNGFKAIHFHAFRKYFRTNVGNVCGRDFAEALMGHGFYMDTYYQLPDDEKRQKYLDAEPNLTVSDFQQIEKNLKTLAVKYSELEAKFNEFKLYASTDSVMVPSFLKST